MKNKPLIIKPRGPWVLVKPIDIKSQNEYGLTVPDSVEKEQKAQGEVVEVGPLTNLKKGQKVLYGAYAGEPIHLEDREKKPTTTNSYIDLILLMDEDIIAILQ